MVEITVKVLAVVDVVDVISVVGKIVSEVLVVVSVAVETSVDSMTDVSVGPWTVMLSYTVPGTIEVGVTVTVAVLWMKVAQKGDACDE